MQEKQEGVSAETKGETTQSRPQRGGEAATTRFGMEDSEAEEPNTTGGPAAEQEGRDDTSNGGGRA